MMVYMREYRDFFEESIQIDKQIAVPVIWYEADIRIITDEIHPALGRHDATGIWEENDKPDQT